MMQKYVGSTAARLVRRDRIGTFRAMETAVVLYRAPSMSIDWNQIRLCEVDAEDFKRFGQEFDAVLREISPEGGFTGIFAGLDRVHTIPHWTFNDSVVEADIAMGQSDLEKPPFW